MASDRIRGDRNKKIVILDSSAIMMLFEFSINLENELSRLLGGFHIIIPKPIVEELRLLAEHGKGKKRLIAKPALKLIERYEIVYAPGGGDDSILFLAKKFNGVVLTNDRELRNQVKDLGLCSIYLRGKKKLVTTQEFV